MPKAGLQPTEGATPDHVAADETVIQIDGQRYWLSAAVDPDTNRYVHVRLFPTRAEASMFLSELREKHHVDDATFLADGAPWLQAARHRHGPRFQHETYGNRNAAERVFEDRKRRTNQFANQYRHADPNTVET